MEPAFADDPHADQRVAVHDPAWSHLLDPGEVTRNIAEAGFAQGVKWQQDRVTGIQPGNDGVTVRTESGDVIQADSVVVAAGVWSNRLLKPLGLRSTGGCQAWLPHHGCIIPRSRLKHPIMSVSRFFMLTPMRLGLRLAGTAEFAAIDAEPDYARAKVLVKHAQNYLPGLEGESYSEWMGQRPMMPDSKPVIGQHPNHSQVFYAFGHGHYGLTQGPTSGRIITDLVAGREPHVDLSPFAIDRF